MAMLLLLGYTGAYRDPINRGYPLGNGYRTFMPASMRFNSPDSLSPFGRGGINPYSYCAADPINRTDPSGHVEESVIEETVRDMVNTVASGESPSREMQSIAAMQASGAAIAHDAGTSGALRSRRKDAAAAPSGWPYKPIRPPRDWLKDIKRQWGPVHGFYTPEWRGALEHQFMEDMTDLDKTIGYLEHHAARLKKRLFADKADVACAIEQRNFRRLQGSLDEAAEQQHELRRVLKTMPYHDSIRYREQGSTLQSRLDDLLEAVDTMDTDFFSADLDGVTVGSMSHPGPTIG